MNDDLLVDRLRRLGEVDPPVSVDRAHVLVAGRRRRLARAAGTTGVVLAVVAVAFPAVDALTPDEAHVVPAVPSPTESPVPTPPVARAVVDHAAGTITLPLDPVGPREREWVLLQTARAHATVGCMADHGFRDDWTFDGPVDLQDQSSMFGVWRETDVLAEGYRSWQHDGGRTLSDEEGAAYQACETALVDAGLAMDRDAFRDQLVDAGGWTWAPHTEVGRQVVAEWRTCLLDEGVQPPEDDASMIPEGALELPFEEQVRIGLIDVGCKERHDVVQRLADIEAAGQAAYLERTRGLQRAMSYADEVALVAAEAYLDEHDITIPD